MVRDEVNKWIQANLHVEEYDIDSTALLSDLGMDSITYIKLVVDMEICFNIEFDDEKLSFEGNPTLDDLVQYIEDKVCQKI